MAWDEEVRALRGERADREDARCMYALAERLEAQGVTLKMEGSLNGWFRCKWFGYDREFMERQILRAVNGELGRARIEVQEDLAYPGGGYEFRFAFRIVR